jgi:hypothetical protein
MEVTGQLHAPNEMPTARGVPKRNSKIGSKEMIIK